MKSNLLKGFLTVVIIIALGLIGTSLYKKFNKGQRRQLDQKVAAELAKYREQDAKNLQDPEAKENDVVQSLKRYTLQNLKGSEEYIQHYMKDERARVRAAALESSGSFEWGDMAMFEEALSSSNASMREAALRGLQRRPSNERKALVYKYLPGYEADQKLLALITIYKMSNDSDEKSKITAQVIEHLKEKPVGNASLVGDVFQYMTDPALESFAKSILKTGEKEKYSDFALRYLEDEDLEWLNKNVMELPIWNNINYQIELIDYMQENCPPFRKELELKLDSETQIPRARELLAEARSKNRCK